jgi:transcriptional regulator with XRE-family HTH domain
MVMADLKRLGQRFRELRTNRGITQDEVLKRSAAYGDARSLRKLESGEQRPRRKAIIELLADAIREQNQDVFDELLTLAGYQGLDGEELEKLGLSKGQPQPAEPLGFPSRRVLWLWRLLILSGLVASVFLGWRRSGFDWLCSLLYSGLYAVSVVLEAAHEYRGGETLEAAGAAAALVLPTSLGALSLDSRGLATTQSEGLLYALFLFVLAAVLQWIAVRPALPSVTIVKTAFQAQTAQAAHLKNTIYFLLLVFVFWLPPRHCVEAIRQHATSGLCPKPLWLWIALGAVMAATVPMGSRLLENLKPTPRHNLYINLFWARALLFFLLSATLVIWYSLSVSITEP